MKSSYHTVPIRFGLSFDRVRSFVAVCCLVPNKLSNSSSHLIALNVPIYFFFVSFLAKFVNFLYCGILWRVSIKDKSNGLPQQHLVLSTLPLYLVWWETDEKEQTCRGGILGSTVAVQ